jgi:hypothetical protein
LLVLRLWLAPLLLLPGGWQWRQPCLLYCPLMLLL